MSSIVFFFFFCLPPLFHRSFTIYSKINIRRCPNRVSSQKLTEFFVPQPASLLNDHVLLHIFSHLDLIALSAVAKCSRRLRSLAQRTFRIAMDGRLTLNDEVAHHAAGHTANTILRVFGPLAVHFAYDVQQPPHYTAPLPWPDLNIAELKSMRIDPLRMRLPAICEPGANTAFHQLDSLELYNVYSSRVSPLLHINFRRWFGHLQSLTLNRCVALAYGNELRLPCSLRRLDMDLTWMTAPANRDFRTLLRLNAGLTHLRLREYAWRLRPNELLDALVDSGLQATLESLELIDTDDMFIADDLIYHENELTPRLRMFQRLRVLRIKSRDCLNIVANVPLLQSLARLEVLMWPMANMYLEPGLFLRAFAASVPLNLRQFTVAGPICIGRGEWDDFVAAMPAACKCQQYDDLQLYN